MKKLVAASLSLLMMFAAACSGSSAAGIYELDKVSMKENMLSMVPAEAKSQPGFQDSIDKAVAAMQVTVELKPDGTAVMESKGGNMAPDSSGTGTWKLAGDKLTLTTKDKASGKEETHTANYSGGAFTMEMAEGPMKMKMRFVRRKG